MSFATFDISELPDEADDDYAIKFKTADTMLGVSMSKEEALAVGQALQDSVEGDWDSFDGEHADEIAAELEEM